MKLSKDKCALVAQLDRVTGYEPVGQGFESLQARHTGADGNIRLPRFFVFHLKRRGPYAQAAKRSLSHWDNPRFCRMALRSAAMFSSAKKNRSLSCATVSPRGNCPSTNTAKVSAMSSWK